MDEWVPIAGLGVVAGVLLDRLIRRRTSVGRVLRLPGRAAAA
ncbi:MAG: hypothetical protein JWN46_1135, partial [Acidimicrobiales bacterium]|nr:hypothetical protein [Acidimicrobiales bacterium]